MGCAHAGNRLHERRFLGDLSLASPPGRGQGRSGSLRLVQTFVQASCLLVGMQGGAHDEDPFRPALVAPLRPTGPFTRIPLGRAHRVTTIIGANNLASLARLASRYPRADPGVHRLRRRPGAWQR
jgi:hypothetical protein